MDLIADIGATHTRCALLDASGSILAPQMYNNCDFGSLSGVLNAYLKKRRTTDQPSRAALAVAAPIEGDLVEMTNLGWHFSRTALQESLGLRGLDVVNDFEALAWSLLDLGKGGVRKIGGGKAVARAAIGVIGPGSGLGVASLVPSTDGWTAVGGEGGHVSLPAANAEEARVIEKLHETYAHCSAERVLSGPGLVNLHAAIAELAGKTVDTISPEEVTELAQSGDRLARRTVAQFFAFLGTIASDLALTIGARGGIFIGGGIVPKFVGTLRRSKFRKRFEEKGRYRHYMEAIPTYVITDAIPAFKGLRRLLGYAA